MKKLFLFIVIAITFTSCLDNTDCLNNVKQTYPNAVAVPGKDYVYIAKDTCGFVHIIKVTSGSCKWISDYVVIK